MLRASFFPHQDPLIISEYIVDFEVRHILVDGKSLVDLLFVDAFNKMMIPRDQLFPPSVLLVGFGGRPMMTLGQIDLAVTFGNEFASRMEVITFNVVQKPFQYNAILGRATLNAFGAIAHQNFLCMKIPMPEGIITVCRDQDLARQIEHRVEAPARHVQTVVADINTKADIPSGRWAQRSNQRDSSIGSL